MSISFLGDSLLDTGNLTNVLAPFGIVPFPNPPYTSGKASNGLVLGEAVIEQLGISPDSLILGFRLNPAAASPNPLEDNINYAVAGAATGVFGSAGNDLQNVPVGLQTQVALFNQDIAAASAITPGAEQPDVIISIGSNDVYDALVDLNAFADILSTPTQEDDEALKNDIATLVVSNIDQAINDLEGNVDDIVIFGLSTLGDTPYAIQMDGAVDDLLVGDFSGQTSAFLTDVAEEINAQLIDEYDGSNHAHDILTDNVINAVVDKANTAIDQLENFVNNAIDLGKSIVEGTRFSDQFDNFVDQLPVNDLLDQARDSITGFAENADDFLDSKCGCDAVENVLVVDGMDVFESGLENWIGSLPENLTPITDISYSDYLGQLGQGNPNNLPVDLVVEQFAFLDGSHPTTDLGGFLAAQITPLITAEFPTFGVA